MEHKTSSLLVVGLVIITLLIWHASPEPQVLVKELRYGRRGGLDLACRHDELIQVVSERLGYSAGGWKRGGGSQWRARCRPRPMCSVPYSQTNWYCRGLSACTGMPIERRPLMHRLTCGSDFTNCLRVEYKCVKRRLLTNVCSSSSYESHSGHLTSPAFPSVYPTKRDCACALTASGPGRVVVTSSFFLLRFSEPCRDWMSVRTEADADTPEWKRCGYIPQMEKLEAKSVLIHFHSDSIDQDMGFWTQFSASEPGTKVRVECRRLVYTEENNNFTTVAFTEQTTTYSTPVATTSTFSIATGNYSSTDGIKTESTTPFSRSMVNNNLTFEGQTTKEDKKEQKQVPLAQSSSTIRPRLEDELRAVWRSKEVRTEHEEHIATTPHIVTEPSVSPQVSDSNLGKTYLGTRKISKEFDLEVTPLPLTTHDTTQIWGTDAEDNLRGPIVMTESGNLIRAGHEKRMFEMVGETGADPGKPLGGPSKGGLTNKLSEQGETLSYFDAPQEFHRSTESFLSGKMETVAQLPETSSRYASSVTVMESGTRVTTTSPTSFDIARTNSSHEETKSANFNMTPPMNDVSDEGENILKIVQVIRGHRVVPEKFYKIGENDAKLREVRIPVEPLKGSGDTKNRNLENSLTFEDDYQAGYRGSTRIEEEEDDDEDHHHSEDFDDALIHDSQSDPTSKQVSNQSYSRSQEDSSQSDSKPQEDSSQSDSRSLETSSQSEQFLYRHFPVTEFNKTGNTDNNSLPTPKTEEQEQESEVMTLKIAGEGEKIRGGHRNEVNATEKIQNGDQLEKIIGENTVEDRKEQNKNEGNKNEEELGRKHRKLTEETNLSVINQAPDDVTSADKEEPEHRKHSPQGVASEQTPEAFYDLLPAPSGILRSVEEREATGPEIESIDSGNRKLDSEDSWTEDIEADRRVRPSWNLGASRDLDDSGSDRPVTSGSVGAVSAGGSVHPTPLMSYFQWDPDSVDGSEIFGEHITWVILALAVVGWVVFVVVLVVSVYYVRRRKREELYESSSFFRSSPYSDLHLPHFPPRTGLFSDSFKDYRRHSPTATTSSPLAAGSSSTTSSTSSSSSTSYESVGVDDVDNASNSRLVTSQIKNKNNSNSGFTCDKNRNKNQDLPPSPPSPGKRGNRHLEKDVDGKTEDKKGVEEDDRLTLTGVTDCSRSRIGHRGGGEGDRGVAAAVRKSREQGQSGHRSLCRKTYEPQSVETGRARIEQLRTNRKQPDGSVGTGDVTSGGYHQSGLLMRIAPLGMLSVGESGRSGKSGGSDSAGMEVNCGNGKMPGKIPGQVESKSSLGAEEKSPGKELHRRLSYVAYDESDLWTQDGIMLTAIFPNDRQPPTTTSPSPPFPF